jgi:predicted short-subunit dehydrogenase-like oxidoreductase (DUF2520 family)
VAIIGAGRAGTAFGVMLARAGYPVIATSGGSESQARTDRFLPGARFVPSTEIARVAAAAREADVVVVAVPDDAIGAACGRLAAADAFRPGQHVIHLSGSVSLDALAAAEQEGATSISLHPLLVFPTVEEGVERLGGSAMAVTARMEEGFRFGESLAREIGARPFRLVDEVKPLYHAAAVFCSNYVVAALGVAEELFRLAGVEEPRAAFAPLARAALESAVASGAGAALTGPAARGDIGTVARNLMALRQRAPHSVESYVALARAAAGIAERSGRLRPDDRRRLEEELDRWR